MSDAKPPSSGNLTALLDDLAHLRAPGSEQAWGDALVPGARVGRFLLERELHRNDFLVAFAARDTVLDRPVALKLLRAGPAPLEADWLRHEAETIAGLSHPNLVALYDAGRSEHGPFLVFELLRGESLEDRLARGPLEARDALRIGHEVARGLAHAHASGVAHRDLRARNVFLCEDGTVKVLDLGVAHAFGQVRLDGPDREYVAPEQWRGAPEDERTDLYALGVLLYRMLSGQFPFPGDPLGTATAGPAPAPVLEMASVPRLGELVSRLLAKDPVDRPRDGAAAAALLGALRADESRSSSRSPSLSGSGSRSNSSVRVRRQHRWLRSPAVWLAVLAAVVGTVALSAWLRSRRPTLADATPSIAVIPFTDLSPARDQEHFSDGLSEEILNALSQVDGLRVAGRTSAMAFRGREQDLRTIGRQLGVAAVLEGSVRKDGRRIRVTAQLVKTADGIRLWTRTFERELTGIFEVQDEIASAVVAALEVELLRGRNPSSRLYRTADPEVYNLFLQGRRFLRRDTSAGARLAAAAFQRAVDLDPGYAPAWAGLAFAQFWGWANVADTEKNLAAAKDRARAAADRAVALAPDLADGYAARGFFRINLDRDFAGAAADMERARALAPGDPDIMWRYARSLLGPLGRLDEAIALARRASQLDPLSPAPLSTLGALYLADGHVEKAREAATRSLELWPEQDTAPTLLAAADLLEGRPEAAIASARRSVEVVYHLQFEACALYDLGRLRDSDALLARLVREHGADAPFQIASVHAWRRDPVAALHWVDKSIELRDGGLMDLPIEPLFDRIRQDPLYATMVKRAGLPAPARRPSTPKP